MDRQAGRIEPGAVVAASDGHLGTVKETIAVPGSGHLAYLVVGRGLLDEPITVPAAAIEAIPSPHEVRLHITRAEAAERGAVWSPDARLASQHGQELRIPIVEERLHAGVRPVDLGELIIHTTVETEEQAIRQAVTRDDLIVERIPIDREIAAPVAPRHEGEWLVIPIMREVLVVQKRLVLAEEVRIRTRQVTEEQVVRATVRRTAIEIEDATVHGVSMEDATVRGVRMEDASIHGATTTALPIADRPPGRPTTS